MAGQGVGNTALVPAVCRLIEQYEPEKTRLFTDPVVPDLVSPVIRLMLQAGAMRSFTRQQTEAVAEGIYGAQVCRTRYIDDAVLRSLTEGIGQVVILGAGLDTRAYRLPGIQAVKVFEVDLPRAQEEKKKKLQKHLGRLPENVTYVPADFDRQALEQVMAGTNFDRSRPAIFVWEGVTQYLSEQAVSRTLSFIGSCAPGSRGVFTYVLKSVIERRSGIPGAERLLDRVQESAPWIFGLEPGGLREYLEAFHLRLVRDAGNVDYQVMYLRPLGRAMKVFEGERMAEVRV